MGGRPDKLRKGADPAARVTAKLPPVSLHSLRHGAATYALAAGLDVKIVQERLGHSTSALTLDTYKSVLPNVARAAADAAAAMIPRADTGTDGLPKGLP